ncbi:alpha/beta fold hydrolase [Rhizohabitans arisaemae]|uniref:alpha/beta fold hydrolase n=1 Tax=Rhizohabitans arisaemae TaxID=2720610 RepID=UPI0024B1D84A|nr:alpha/beta hydrolase [Rhizohabitans arisaemae]
MPTLSVNGTTITYQVRGEGRPLLLVCPAATRSSVWDLRQVRPFTAAGYQVITFDNRGMTNLVEPGKPDAYRIEEFVTDTAELIRHLDVGPVHVAGASLGAVIAQELTLAHPGLVRSAVLACTRARVDFFREQIVRASSERVRRSGLLSPEESATTLMFQLFSPDTLADEHTAADWFDVFCAFPVSGEGAALEYEATLTGDRRGALRGVTRPVLVIGFSDDLLMPPSLCREVADAIPDAKYVEISGCGHFGFLEHPDLFNRHILDFLATT